jgi:ferric-dicitrate binding protein FerR (iron transport regulator)
MINKKYLINEFLANPEFVRWVKDPDKELDIYWGKWMEANPELMEEIKLAREIILGFNFTHQMPESSLKETVLNNILNSSKSPEVNGDSEKSSFGSFFWENIAQHYKVAAILVLTFGMSFLVNIFTRQAVVPEPVAEIITVRKFTANGEKLNFKLPDGSMVWLNSGSELRYPEEFDSAARIVHLKGEAFFNVDKGHPGYFSVISDNFTTTALGTSFNVNNSPDALLSISLVSGKVKVENGLTRENILLLPGQQLQYTEGTNKTVVGSFDEKRVTGWRSGILHFSNASFDEVQKQLESWYGVNIEVKGKPSRKWNLTGEYHNQNLYVVLSRISYIEDFKFSIQDKNVQIKF